MAEKLREQVGYPYQQGVVIKRRQPGATQTHEPASRHYAGHYAGNHPEDTPYITQDRPRRALPPVEYDEEDDDNIYPQRPPTSTRRYIQPPHEVYTDVNRKIVVHREPPPKKRRVNLMVFVGLAMAIMVVGYVLLSAFGAWWQGKQDDWKYGVPRTFQADQFVGHSDSPTHPNHFVAINLGGTIEVVEINTQIPKDDHIYGITTASDSLTPVSIAFNDINHDGKVDLLITIGDSNPYTVVMLNNGSVFQH
jgi:hypothetical protein